MPAHTFPHVSQNVSPAIGGLLSQHLESGQLGPPPCLLLSLQNSFRKYSQKMCLIKNIQVRSEFINLLTRIRDMLGTAPDLDLRIT